MPKGSLRGRKQNKSKKYDHVVLHMNDSIILLYKCSRFIKSIMVVQQRGMSLNDHGSWSEL